MHLERRTMFSCIYRITICRNHQGSFQTRCIILKRVILLLSLVYMNSCFIIFIPAAALTPNQDTSNYVEDAIEVRGLHIQFQTSQYDGNKACINFNVHINHIFYTKYKKIIWHIKMLLFFCNLQRNTFIFRSFNDFMLLVQNYSNSSMLTNLQPQSFRINPSNTFTLFIISVFVFMKIDSRNGSNVYTKTFATMGSFI